MGLFAFQQLESVASAFVNLHLPLPAFFRLDYVGFLGLGLGIVVALYLDEGHYLPSLFGQSAAGLEAFLLLYLPSTTAFLFLLSLLLQQFLFPCSQLPHEICQKLLPTLQKALQQFLLMAVGIRILPYYKPTSCLRLAATHSAASSSSLLASTSMRILVCLAAFTSMTATHLLSSQWSKPSISLTSASSAPSCSCWTWLSTPDSLVSSMASVWILMRSCIAVKISYHRPQVLTSSCQSDLGQTEEGGKSIIRNALRQPIDCLLILLHW